MVLKQGTTMIRTQFGYIMEKDSPKLKYQPRVQRQSWKIGFS